MVNPFDQKVHSKHIENNGSRNFLLLANHSNHVAYRINWTLLHHCISLYINDKAATGTIPIPLYWVLMIEFVNGIGVVMTLCSLFEFVMVQAPNKMRGLIMGLALTMYGTSELGVVLLLTKHAVPTAPNSHTQLCVPLLPGTMIYSCC